MTSIADNATETIAPLTLRGLSIELIELEGLLNSVYDDTEPPATASYDERAEYLARRQSVEDALFEYFVANEETTNIKIDGYVGLIREFELRAAARKQEADRVSKLAKADANKVDALKYRLKNFLEFTKQSKVATLHHSISIANNGGRLALLLDPIYAEEPEKLPAQFQKVVIAPNNDAIRKVLEDGGELPFATLGERGTSLRIK